MPQPFGKFFDGNERLSSENSAALRRHRNKRGIGKGVGGFQLFKRDNVRVIRAEVIPNVDIDSRYAGGTRSERQHDKQRERDGQPPATDDE